MKGLRHLFYVRLPEEGIPAGSLSLNQNIFRSKKTTVYLYASTLLFALIFSDSLLMTEKIIFLISSSTVQAIKIAG